MNKFVRPDKEYDVQNESSLMTTKKRNKRGITERQTGEKFRSVRRNCRVLRRSCNGNKRFDDDVVVLNYTDGNKKFYGLLQHF